MAWLRVDSAHLLPWIRRSLTGLLRTLGPTQWGAPTVCGDWTVGDIAAHLLAVELGNVSQRRDSAHARQSDPDGDLSPGEWLATFDDQWVVAARRLSPRVLVDMLDLAGIWFEDHVSGMRLDGMGPPVGWAMPQPAPLWMDIAHEYTQRWVYQQRIRDVVGEPGLLEPTYLAPAIATFVNSLPGAFDGIAAPRDSVVGIDVSGEAGGSWHLVLDGEDWDLRAGAHRMANAHVTMTDENAWRVFTGHPSAVAPDLKGDDDLAAAVARRLPVTI